MGFRTGIVVSPTYEIQPPDLGYQAWSFDPAPMVSTGSILGVAGTLYLSMLKIERTTLVTNIVMHMGVSGASLTAGQCFAGLFSAVSPYARIGVTGDLAATFVSAAGVKAMPLAPSPVTVAPGLYYVGVYANGTTLPTFTNGASTSIANAGSIIRFATANTGLTTAMPANLSGIAARSNAMWVAVS